LLIAERQALKHWITIVDTDENMQRLLPEIEELGDI
jgi:hypothetical protein